MDKAHREGLLTTLEAAFKRLDQPMALGYSSSGVIEAVGIGLQSFKVGDRVACAGGGYAVHAEYALVPSNLLASLPETIDFESAALLPSVQLLYTAFAFLSLSLANLLL